MLFRLDRNNYYGKIIPNKSKGFEQMKFSEMQYVRPDLEKAGAKYEKLIEQVKNAQTAETVFDAILEHEKVLMDFSTAQSLVNVRHSIDTEDKFYDEENDFLDQAGPLFEEKMQPFIQALLDTKFRPDCEKRFGKLLFVNAEMAVKCFSPAIVDLLQEENKLVSEYDKLIASAKIEFDGKTLNLAQLGPYKENADRAVRKAAYEADGSFFMANAEKFDELYDKLVKVRTEIGKKLGYDTFTPVGYMRMQRNCYTPELVDTFRKQVIDDLVPVANRLRELQAKRIGLEKLSLYDLLFTFKEGNPKPDGTSDELVAAAVKMYHEMSERTGEFIDFMTDSDLMDLLTKPKKAGGGFCTLFANYKAPFIFANFNGTQGDVGTLTHEAGHAYAFYIAVDDEIYETAGPSLDACEIHSMSMEFFAWPWLENFYGKDAERARLAHLEESVTFIPYGTMVDHFQHIMYENPDLTPAQRHEEWMKLEKQYRPYIDFENVPCYSQGRGWQRQSHIYEVAFYYIDYCLAQSVALAFWALSRKDRKDAWERYNKLVDCTGKKTFIELCKVADIKDPFTDGCLKQVAATAFEYLDKI